MAKIFTKEFWLSWRGVVTLIATLALAIAGKIEWSQFFNYLVGLL